MSLLKIVVKKLLPKNIIGMAKQIKKRRSLKEHQDYIYKKWQKNGCPVPPPHLVKQLTIKQYQKKYGHTVLIETGTYLGEMIDAQKKNFDQIISIELGEDLYNKAMTKFGKDENVLIVQGDSGKVLPDVLKKIQQPAIFWLDGHYSSGITAKGEKECPIFEELYAIFENSEFNHVILIDDARCFNGQGDYPTIAELQSYIHAKAASYKMEVKHDIIRFFI